MSDQKILDYVDNVMSGIEASDELKAKIENELIRYILEASEKTGMDEVKSSICSPEKFSEELSKKLAVYNHGTQGWYGDESDHRMHHKRRHPMRYTGEFMQEHSNVNLKLLYIPLLQISSGTQRMVMPLMDEDDDD